MAILGPAKILTCDAILLGIFITVKKKSFLVDRLGQKKVVVGKGGGVVKCLPRLLLSWQKVRAVVLHYMSCLDEKDVACSMAEGCISDSAEGHDKKNDKIMLFQPFI